MAEDASLLLPGDTGVDIEAEALKVATASVRAPRPACALSRRAAIVGVSFAVLAALLALRCARSPAQGAEGASTLKTAARLTALWHDAYADDIDFTVVKSPCKCSNNGDNHACAWAEPGKLATWDMDEEDPGACKSACKQNKQCAAVEIRKFDGKLSCNLFSSSELPEFIVEDFHSKPWGFHCFMKKGANGVIQSDDNFKVVKSPCKCSNNGDNHACAWAEPGKLADFRLDSEDPRACKLACLQKEQCAAAEVAKWKDKWRCNLFSGSELPKYIIADMHSEPWGFHCYMRQEQDAVGAAVGKAQGKAFGNVIVNNGGTVQAQIAGGNLQAAQQQAKKCEGSGNAVDGVGAAQVVCCAGRTMTCCDHASTVRDTVKAADDADAAGLPASGSTCSKNG